MSGSADDDRSGQAAVTGVAGAAGRDSLVDAQIRQAEHAARGQPATPFNGEVYRAVAPEYVTSYSDHSFSSPGRYNGPGQSTLYTAAGIADLRAETANYAGLDGKAVIRSSFSGTLLDLRETPGVTHGALTEGYGENGRKQSLLGRIAGEDPYTVPRALGDVARARDVSGVIVPANRESTNVNLFPDDPNAAAAGPGRIATGLRALDVQVHPSGAAPRTIDSDPAIRNVPDATPNRRSPGVIGEASYAEAVAADAGAHGRSGGLRYGAAGAAAADLITGAVHGSIDGRRLAVDTGAGAVLGQAETHLAQAADRLIGVSAVPPRIATGAASGLEATGAGAIRPPSLAAGAGAAGVIGGVVNGGVAIWNDADQVKGGHLTAGRATADVAVQTGVGLAAGASGAAAGAAVGSVVPVVGTAAGAVVGFGVGVGVSYAAQHSAALHSAERAAGDYLTAHFEQPLQQAWRPVTVAVDTVRDGATRSTQVVEATVERNVQTAEALAARGGQALAGAAASAQASVEASAHEAVSKLSGWFGGASSPSSGAASTPQPASNTRPAAATQGTDYWKGLESRHDAKPAAPSETGVPSARAYWDRIAAAGSDTPHAATASVAESVPSAASLRR